MAIQIGDSAPDFVLPDSHGAQVRLSELWQRGPVVLYFYPKDDTQGCTAEACSFRDSYQAFKDAGAEVVGVSSDDEDSHRAFASKYHLPFVLVSDRGGAVRKRYGVKPTLGFIPGRTTYVIDSTGVVRHVFNAQIQATRHVTEALDVLQNLSVASSATR